jgi:hypothetical protein
MDSLKEVPTKEEIAEKYNGKSAFYLKSITYNSKDRYK